MGICLVNFFIFVNFHALLPTFPFFVTYLGGDAQTIGLATALFSIASIISRPFAGRMVDTTGRRTVLTLGLFGLATLMAVVALIIGLSIGKRDYTLDHGPMRWKQLFERRSLPAAIAQFFYMMSYGVIEVYVAIYAESCGLPGAIRTTWCRR